MLKNVMRVLSLAILAFISFSGQSYGGVCCGSCNHEIHSQNDTGALGHDCCEKRFEANQTVGRHRCSLTECLVSWQALPSDSFVPEMKEGSSQPDLLVETYFFIALLRQTLAFGGYLGVGPPPSTVPLYIIYKKLLISYDS